MSNNTKELHVYLLRGLTRESGHWGSFIDMLERNLPDAKIHFLDLPGAGKHFEMRAPAKILKMVEFMRSLHLAEISRENRLNVICATSLGGMLAADWVLRHPEDFSGLILIGSSFKNICTLKERVHPRVRWEMVKTLFSSNIRKRERLIIGVNSNKPENFDALTEDWTKVQQERTMTRGNIFRQTIAGMRFGLKDQKPKVPVLIVGSKGDRMVCPECIKKSHAFMGGTLVWHETAGHGIPIDAPEWLSHQISKWCKTQFI